MNENEIRAVLIELRLILENLCYAELNESGREYIRKRISNYENRLSEASPVGDRDIGSQ